jgi:hypothetical protein
MDSDLTEVHFPLLPGVSGAAPGDAEYGSRLVARAETTSDIASDGAANGDEGEEKVAWVVQPGMGQIGDRYYLV